MKVPKSEGVGVPENGGFGMEIPVKHQWRDGRFPILGGENPNPSVLGKPEGTLRASERGQCRLIPSCCFLTLSPEPPKVTLTPAPLIWAAPREAPPELLCLVSHFYPSEGLEVEWELWGGPEGRFQKAEGQRWLSALSHHSDGSVSLSAHLQPPPVTTGQHGARYACRVHHPSLPALGRSAEVTLQVAGKSLKYGETGRGVGRGAWEFQTHSCSFCLPGLSGPSLEDGVGLFLSAFLLLGLINVLGWAGECKSHPGWDP